MTDIKQLLSTNVYQALIGLVGGSDAPSSSNLFVTASEISGSSVTSGITAHAGGGQTGATQLTTTYSFIDTVVSNEDSVKLLAATKNTRMIAINRGVGDLNVYPLLGDSFYGQAVNTPYKYPIVNGSSLEVISDVNGTWSIIP
jgi:hypothetical protein